MNISAVKVAAKGHNRYCGPAALSIVTGVDTAQAASLLRKISGARSVRGVSLGNMLMAFNRLGYRATAQGQFNPLKVKDNPTLAAWLRDTHGERGGRVFLVSAGGHWQVVSGNRFCCGVTKKVVGLNHESVKRRARISGVWELKGLETVQPAPNCGGGNGR